MPESTFAAIGRLALSSENSARLNTCKVPHSFVLVIEDAINAVHPHTRFRCEKRKGEVPVDAAVWYAKGQADGPERY